MVFCVWRREVGRRSLIRGVRIGVELAESRRAGLGELRVEHETLHAALAALRLNGDAPLRVADIEVRRHCLAIGAQRVQRTAHVADEKAPRGRLFDEGHHARGDASDVGKGREFAKRDCDDALVAGDRLRERIVRLPRGERLGGAPPP